MDAGASAAAAAEAATVNEQNVEKSGACIQCVERCQREHRLQPLHPCFLRTVTEHNLRNNMAIPKAFVQMHGRNLPGSTVDLEGVNGKVWLVTVVMSTAGTAVFRFGWHVFAADNNLKPGDQLLFTMVAKNRFIVRVFTKDGLESELGKPAIAMKRINSVQPPTPGVQHYNLDDDESDEFMGAESGHSGSSDENGWGAAGTAGEGGIHGGHGPTIKEIIQNAHASQTAGEPVKRRIRNSNPRRPKRHTTTPRRRDSQGSPVTSQRRPVTNEERDRAVAASQTLVTTRPSVAVVMMPWHVYHNFWLSIPMEFSRQHFPPGRVKITLQDARGVRWPAEWISDNTHTGVATGWAAFSRDHRLEEGDVCVFEILDSESHTLLVHISRVVETVVLNPSLPPHQRAPLPDLNETNDVAVKPEPAADGDAHPPRKRNGLADVLHEMIRSGQFSREDCGFSSNKIRALVEDGMRDDNDSDAKRVEPIGDTTISMFQRPRCPHSDPVNNLSISGPVKAEPEDVYSTATPRPPVITEPVTYVVKTEDVSPVVYPDVSPVAVYTRRRRGTKEGGTSVVSGVPCDERVWYPVVRVLDKRQREGVAEKELLLEILGTVPDTERGRYEVVEQRGDGLWWVPSSHFSKDYSSCYFS